MDEKISDDQMRQLSALVAEVTGLHFPPARWPDLQRGVLAVAETMGFADLSECIRSLTCNPRSKAQVEALASNLTVGETYFFRDRRSFEVLSQEILPDLIRARSNGERRLRIWSAACCTGEEPYSIAITLHRALKNLGDWNITLLASDINPQFLRKAEAGVFGPWSFRDAPAWLQADYFSSRSDGRFEIAPQIKRMVHFAQLNLAEDVYPALASDTNAMDVIFCRNVLMYFTPAAANRVLEKLHRAQVENGWLFVSPTELPHLSASSYRTVDLAGATLCRREHRAAVAPVEAPMHALRLPVDSPIPSPIEAVCESKETECDRAAELYSRGEYDQAIAALRASASDHPNHLPTLLLLARCFANQGQLDDALRCCDGAVQADKLEPAAHYLRATVLQEQGELDEAVGSLLRALYLDSRFALAHFALGNIAQQRGENYPARMHYRHALAAISACEPDEIVRESDGITARRFTEILLPLLREKAAA